MGFFRKQEENLAVKLLKWKYQRMNSPLPHEKELKRQAVRIVDDAHHIAKEKGHSIYRIIKESIDEMKKDHKKNE